MNGVMDLDERVRQLHKLRDRIDAELQAIADQVHAAEQKRIERDRKAERERRERIRAAEREQTQRERVAEDSALILAAPAEAVRTWARERDIEIGDRGRISRGLRHQYLAELDAAAGAPE